MEKHETSAFSFIIDPAVQQEGMQGENLNVGSSSADLSGRSETVPETVMDPPVYIDAIFIRTEIALLFLFFID
jgi:hypothetical protein